MKCPFCGEEMREGAIQTKEARSGVDSWLLRWVPPIEGAVEEPIEAPPLVKDLLEKAPPTAQAIVDRAEGMWSKWKQGDWDVAHGFPLRIEKGERKAREVLFTGDIYILNSWYCPQCEKAICVFDQDRDEPQNAYLDENQGWTPPSVEKESPKPQAPTPPLPPKPRTKPRDDPWEQKGLFRKKPDWEK